jgi:tRNA(fMet)-specific endonuclease VapC
MNYLLDTNICIYFLKGVPQVVTKVKEAGLANCAISELTIAELKYGAENSVQKEKNRRVLDEFIKDLKVLPITPSFDVYAKEKTRLRRSGTIIDDFDLLIGATAIVRRRQEITL